MARDVYAGTMEELIAFAKDFEIAGAELLTVTLMEPPGARGIEQLGPLISAFH